MWLQRSGFPLVYSQMTLIGLQISWKFEAQTGSIHGKVSLQQKPLAKFKYLHALECTTSFLWTLSVVRTSRELVFDVYVNSPKSGARCTQTCPWSALSSLPPYGITSLPFFLHHSLISLHLPCKAASWMKLVPAETLGYIYHCLKLVRSLVTQMWG